jgi:class 3 adenylate cyclase
MSTATLETAVTEPLNYSPKPLDTSQFKLSDDLVKLTELLAENTHEVWARERMAQGWKYGTKRDDNLKEHPCLVPYKDLPESEKKVDREAAMETIKTVLSLGYPKTSQRGDANDTAIIHSTDLDEKCKKVIGQLKNQKLTVAQLRRIWEERIPIVWLRNVDVYRRAVDAALRVGEAFTGFDIAVEGLGNFKGDLRLIQLQALALARTGATKRANEILEQLRVSGHQDEETLGILARTHKDFWQIANDPKEKAEHLRLSYELYAEGYRRNRGYYTGINAASMGLIYGEKEVAHQIAGEVIQMCEPNLAKLAPDSDERYWLEATLAEAALIQGELEKAEQYYSQASTGSRQSWVVLNRTRAQAKLLLEHSGRPVNALDHCFKLPRIVVCSGHMFDKLSRKQLRMPYWLEDRIRAEVKSRLANLEAQVGFSSLACGADMLFAEALLERGGEVNIVFPFQQEDFRASSVDIIPGMDFGVRFDQVLKNAANVTTLNEAGTANDGAAYEYCNLALIGLALLKGQFLGIDVSALAVWDGKIGDGRGGTQSFVEFWRSKGCRVEIIRTDEILAEELRLHPERAPQFSEETPPTANLTTTTSKGQTSASSLANGMPAVADQEIKAMLFADIKGFTKLTEMQVPDFMKHFMGSVARLMDSLPNQPIVKNTWGDAVYCVFDKVEHAGLFALKLRDLVRGTDWVQKSLPPGMNIRIALHAGPAYPCFDPVMRKLTFMGSHVNRTARIEPVAEEGQIYASQAFAALSAADDAHGYVCDYVGMVQLAKKYGSIPVFLLRAKS